MRTQAIRSIGTSDAPRQGSRRRVTAHRESSASIGPANQVVQARLRIGRADDPLEREADRIADQVVSGDGAPATVSAHGPPAISPNRGTCAAADDGTIRRLGDDGLQMKEAGGCAACGDDVHAAASVLAAPGPPLASALRAYFEPRFGHDFSGVRLHTDAAAGQAASRIGARAYALGNDIAFAQGEYAPETPAGRRLIAHELSHVVQQRDGTAAALRRDREGTTEFRERVTGAPSRAGSVLSGAVERTEVVPASATEAETQVQQATVGVTFDESKCKVEVARRVKFQQAGASGTPGICDGSPPLAQAVDPLPNDRFRRLKADYIDAVNDGLNGWYTARLEGAACAAPCMGGDIPIRIELIEDATNPDFTINVVNREGRGDAATICAREGGLRGFAIHEGGHQMLGVGDEYPELDAAVCKRVPQWCRAERVRDKDWSRMGSHGDYGRFALFHERHFQFVPAFLNAAYPDCKAQLVELRRPLLPDFRVGFSFGVASLGGGSSYLMSAGLSFGIPASRLRDVEAVIGVQATSMLGSLPDLREALLLGVRVGIERRSTPSAGGFTGSAFLESGVGRFSASDPKTYERQKSSAPYAQIGLGFGYTFSPNPLFQPYVGVEATAGTAFSTKGTIGEAEAGGRDDESWRHWFGLGVSLGARF